MGASESKTSMKERQLVMQYHNMSAEKFDSIFRTFKIRAGKKGYLSFQDFCALYDSSRFEQDSSDQLAVFRALADSERLTLGGFVRLFLLCERDRSPPGNPAESECLRVLFSVMDCDNSGAISESEFARFLANFVDDEKTMQKFFDRADGDSSRMIDFYEFADFCRKHRGAYRLMCSYVFPPRA